MSYFLLDNENPNAGRGADGRRFHGHAARRGQAKVIVVHTAENIPDISGEDLGAENVARYLSTTDRQASYHTVVDADSIVRLLPHSYVAFHVRSFNSTSLGLSFATRAAEWARLPDERVTSALANGAREARSWSEAYAIPTVRINVSEALSGGTGFVSHSQMDPTRRTDPGRDFPWDRFLSMVSGSPPPPPDDTLKFGDTGADVADLQRFLALHGSPRLQADGVFGANTRLAVVKWQRRNSVVADGVWRPEDRTAEAGAPSPLRRYIDEAVQRAVSDHVQLLHQGESNG